jgi:hypothetical protein
VQNIVGDFDNVALPSWLMLWANSDIRRLVLNFCCRTPLRVVKRLLLGFCSLSLWPKGGRNDSAGAVVLPNSRNDSAGAVVLPNNELPHEHHSNNNNIHCSGVCLGVDLSEDHVQQHECRLFIHRQHICILIYFYIYLLERTKAK